MTEVLYSNVNDNTPVLVGCAQYVDKSGSDGKNFLEILDVVARKAIEDCNSQNNC